VIAKHLICPLKNLFINGSFIVLFWDLIDKIWTFFTFSIWSISPLGNLHYFFTSPFRGASFTGAVLTISYNWEVWLPFAEIKAFLLFKLFASFVWAIWLSGTNLDGMILFFSRLFPSLLIMTYCFVLIIGSFDCYSVLKLVSIVTLDVFLCSSPSLKSYSDYPKI